MTTIRLRSLDAWSVRRRAALVALATATVALVAFAPHAAAYWRALLLFDEVIVRSPLRPLPRLTESPSVEPMSWGASGRGLLTLPAGSSEAPAVILELGAEPAPFDDPRVVRLTSALARVGVAVLLPLSDELTAKRVLAVDVERMVEGFEALEAHPRVQGRPVGVVGLSAGGSLAIVAASDPRIAERVAFVLAIGPYFDAASLVASVAAEAYRLPDGTAVPWDPARTTREVVRATLEALLPPAEVQAVLAPAPLSAAQQTAARALASEVELRAVSPRYHLAGLRAPLYLIHGRSDAYIPWTESAALAAARPPAAYHLVGLFGHVEPGPLSVGVLARDGWRVFTLLAAVLERLGEGVPSPR